MSDQQFTTWKCSWCGRFHWSVTDGSEPARVPVGELRELAEEWREQAEWLGAESEGAQAVKYVELKQRADELQDVIESYTDNE